MTRLPSALKAQRYADEATSQGVPALVIVAEGVSSSAIEADLLSKLKEGHEAVQVLHSQLVGKQMMQAWAISTEDAQEVPATDYPGYAMAIPAEWIVRFGANLEAALPDMSAAITDFSIIDTSGGFVTVTLLANEPQISGLIRYGDLGCDRLEATNNLEPGGSRKFRAGGGFTMPDAGYEIELKWRGPDFNPAIVSIDITIKRLPGEWEQVPKCIPFKELKIVYEEGQALYEVANFFLGGSSVSVPVKTLS